MKNWIIAGAVILALGAGFYLFVRFQKREAKREALEQMLKAREGIEQWKQYRNAEAQKDKTTLSEKLAGLVADPDKEKPVLSKQDGESEVRVYSLQAFERAELLRVKGRPEAWSWLLVSPHGVSAMDFGPPGSIRDLMTGKAPVAGYPVSGLLHVIERGPLSGAVLVYSPPMFSEKATYQVGTVAFHQWIHSPIMEPLCDFGLVPDRKVISSTEFKRKCHAAVAKQLGRDAETLFPKPWLKRPGKTESNCDRILQGVPDGMQGPEFTCRWDSTAGKLSVTIGR